MAAGTDGRGGAGLRKDWPVATASLTLPGSPGTVEGHVHRIKIIKRQICGRARPDLLRKRVLLAGAGAA
jgi:transposase